MMKHSYLKKGVLALMVSLSVLGLQAPSGVTAADMAASPSSAAASQVSRPAVKNLKIGSVAVYDFGRIKIHAYQSKDPLGDETYVFETDKNLVLLESTAFKANNREWAEYIQSLKRPIAGELMAYHPNGAGTYGAKVYATETALKNWQKGGSIYNLTASFDKGFGPAVSDQLPARAKILKEGQYVGIGGILFHILPAGDAAYSIELPQIHVVYRHMMGSHTHNILTSTAHMDAEIASMQQYRKAGYALVLTGHNVPEGQEAVAEKLAYFKTMKRLASENRNKADFVKAARKAFPNYQGDNYLMMTTDFLYKE